MSKPPGPPAPPGSPPMPGRPKPMPPPKPPWPPGPPGPEPSEPERRDDSSSGSDGPKPKGRSLMVSTVRGRRADRGRARTPTANAQVCAPGPGSDAHGRSLPSVPVTRLRATLALGLVLAGVLGLLGATVRVPFVALGDGPTFDVL